MIKTQRNTCQGNLLDCTCARSCVLLNHKFNSSSSGKNYDWLYNKDDNYNTSNNDSYYTYWKIRNSICDNLLMIECLFSQVLIGNKINIFHRNNIYKLSICDKYLAIIIISRTNTNRINNNISSSINKNNNNDKIILCCSNKEC